jgi:predicted ATPase
MLKTIELSGFKSIREMKLDLKQINVLIGANGAGKSNLFEILKLLKSIQDNRLQFYIGQAGGANSLLHYGTNITKQISANFCFELDKVLTTMALITLLLQPESDLPSLIALDEPEIGLHPYAINIIASLIQTVSVHTQIILATQSSTFLNHFDPSDIIVVEQQNGISRFKHLVPDSLNEWLTKLEQL